MNRSIKTTCPYCGVGCGIEAVVDHHARRVTIQGDKTHPANFGRLCSKGAALGETLDLQGRLLQPRVHGNATSWNEALDLVASEFRKIIDRDGPDALAIYASGQLLTEDYYVANKLMKGFIGSANIDTNSRLCMSSSVAGHKRAFGADTVPGCYEDLELADLMVLIGSNAAWCHPVIFQRIRAAKASNPGLKIVVIDPRQTASCEIADLHLPLASGSDAALFNGLLTYLADRQLLDQRFIDQHTEGFSAAMDAAGAYSLEQVSQQCRLDPDAIRCFYDWFGERQKVLSLYSQGINQSSSGTDKVNSIINCHLATGKIGKPGMGPFSLTGQPNAMGGREVGGLAHQLAAHMEFSNQQDVDRVARFWGSPNLARKPGYSAVELFEAIDAGKVKAVWIMGTNPVVSLPNADQVKQALQRCPLVVVSDCSAATDTTALADVLLPAQGWSEKDGTVTNSERRISRQRALLPTAGDAKPDWWIISQIGQRLGFKQAFDYRSAFDIFLEHASLSGFENDRRHGVRDFDLSGLAQISAEEYRDLAPIQWPINRANPGGTSRLFGDGRFFTATTKARLVAVTAKAPVNPPSMEYPLILNTGRIRDQWHTMTRTAIASKLNQHKPEPYLEIHPDDAATYQLATDDLACLESAWGRMLARVSVTDSVRPGNVFIPIHWSSQFASQGRVGALVNAVVDPLSKQPESKHTPVRIHAYFTLWQGFAMSRQELDFAAIEYWVKIKGDGFYRYELAAQQIPANWHEWVKSRFGNQLPSGDWQEYFDSGLGQYRTALIVDNQLHSVFFSAPHRQQLPNRGWLASLFAQSELSEAERLTLLTGRPPQDQPDVGAIVCACFNVGANTLRQVIRDQGLTTVQEVGHCLKAGSNCGSCLSEIKAILQDAGEEFAHGQAR